MDLQKQLQKYKEQMLGDTKNHVCSDCGKNCKDDKKCIITQYWNELNEEAKEQRKKPFAFFIIQNKLKSLPKVKLTYLLSECKDYKNRNGSFGKRFWGEFKKHDWK